MRSIVIIGPKKTATTAIYNVLRANKQLLLHRLWPKESNYLINARIEDLGKLRGSFIDISPEYFTSFRALMKLRYMQESGLGPHVFVINRPDRARLMSHLNYMLKKGEISSSWCESEIECLALSHFAPYREIGLEVRSGSAKEVLRAICDITGLPELELGDANSGAFEVRSRLILTTAKKIASVLRRLPGGGTAVEFIAELVGSLIYERRKPTGSRGGIGNDNDGTSPTLRDLYDTCKSSVWAD